MVFKLVITCYYTKLSVVEWFSNILKFICNMTLLADAVVFCIVAPHAMFHVPTFALLQACCRSSWSWN